LTGKAIKVQKRRWNTANYAAAVAVALPIAMLLIFTLLAVQSYREQAERAEQQAMANAQLVSLQTSWLVTASQQALERIHDRLEREPFAPDDAVLAEIRETIAHLPGDPQTVVYDAKGNLRISDTSSFGPSNISLLPYFQALEAGLDTLIAAVALPDDPDQTGFAIARRLDSDGAFSGIAVIVISDSMLAGFARTLKLGAGSTLAIVGSDAWLVSRYPSQAEPLHMGEYELFTEHLVRNRDSGTYFAQASPADGVARFVGYQAIPGLPLIAVAGIAVDTMYASFWRSVLIVLGLLLPISVALFVLACMLWRAATRDQRAQQKLGAALEHNTLLFREIHHRVKNNLQAVASLVQLQPIPDPVKQEMARRIAAMVAVHEHVYRTDQFTRTELSGYIEKLVADIVTGFDTNAQVQTKVKPVIVHRDHAMPLALIVNEVLCNAIKYAFPDGEKGTIWVELAPVNATNARLIISDNGIGLDPKVNSTGMGRKLIHGLATQVGGSYTLVGENGSRFQMDFPIEPLSDEEGF